MKTIAVVHVIANNVQKRKELFLTFPLLIIIGEIFSGSGTSLRQMFMLNVLFVLVATASLVKGRVARFERSMLCRPETVVYFLPSKIL